MHFVTWKYKSTMEVPGWLRLLKASALGLGQDPRVLGLSPTVGSLLSASLSLSPSAPPHLPPSHALSLSNNKTFKKAPQDSDKVK